MTNAIKCRKKHRLFEIKVGLQYDCNMGKQVLKFNIWKLHYLQVKCRVMCSISKSYSRKYNSEDNRNLYNYGRSSWKLNCVQEPQLA
jgi:hypothetical protein